MLIQIIDGITIDQYNSDNITYPLTLKETIASLMDGVNPSDIIDLEVVENMDSSEESSESRRLRSADSEAEGRRLQNSTVSNSISAEYVVKVHNSNLTYSTTSGQLKDGVADGTFDRNINVFAANNGALAFVNTTSTSVSTENLVNDGGDGGSKKKDDDDDSDDGLSDGAIAGIVIGVLVGIAFMGCMACCGKYFNKGKSSNGPHRSRKDWDLISMSDLGGGGGDGGGGDGGGGEGMGEGGEGMGEGGEGVGGGGGLMNDALLIFLIKER